MSVTTWAVWVKKGDRGQKLVDLVTLADELGVGLPEDVYEEIEEGHMRGLGMIENVEVEDVPGEEWHAKVVSLSDIPHDAVAIAFIQSW